jgi:hypothetical protein
MKDYHEVRFKVTNEDYYYLEGMSGFYFDHRVIPRATVHSLAKSATIRAANEWKKVESIALEARKKRQQILGSISDYKT